MLLAIFGIVLVGIFISCCCEIDSDKSKTTMEYLAKNNL